MNGYSAKFRGEPKGQIFKVRGRWIWERPNNKGLEIYPRLCGLLAVRAHIGRLCGGKIADVKLERTEIA